MTNENVKKGTTVAALKYGDRAVIAAERRVSEGLNITGNIKKLRKINENVVLGGAGYAGHIQILGDYLAMESNLKKYGEDKEMTANSVAKILSHYAVGAGGEFVVIGKNVDTIGIYLIDAAYFKGEFTDNFIAVGSGQELAMGALETDYPDLLEKERKGENVEDDDLAKLAAKAIYAATKRNMGSGGPVDLYLVDAKRGTREYSWEELQMLLGVS